MSDEAAEGLGCLFVLAVGLMVIGGLATWGVESLFYIGAAILIFVLVLMM